MPGPVARHRVISGFVALSALLLTVLNVMCQRLVDAGLLQDRLLFDYVNDLMAPPLVICTLIAWRSRIPLTLVAGVAAAFTVIELFRWPDPFDILAYWFSALAIHLLLNRSGDPV